MLKAAWKNHTAWLDSLTFPKYCLPNCLGEDRKCLNRIRLHNVDLSVEAKYGREVWEMVFDFSEQSRIQDSSTAPPHSSTVLLFLVIKPEASEGFTTFLCSLSWSYSECFINIQNVRAIWLKHMSPRLAGWSHSLSSSISPTGSFWESCTWWKGKTFPRTGGHSLVIKVTWVVLGVELGCMHAQLLTCVWFFSTPWNAAPSLLCP